MLYIGINYMCVYYVCKLNTILLHTMRNREDTGVVVLSKSCYNELNVKEHHPTLYVLDNECSRAVKEYITSEKTNM